MKTKWWLAVTLLLAAPQAWGQCSGYSASDPYYALLTPAQFAAYGGVTATLTVAPYDAAGNLLDSTTAQGHKLTVTPQTWVGLTWKSANGTSPILYYTINSDSTRYSQGPISLNGSNPHWAYMTPADVGRTYTVWFVFPDSNGNPITQDRISVTVVNGPDNTMVSQDSIPTNFYMQISTAFGGPSMMNACTVCQLHPNECIGNGTLTHTPFVTMHVHNNTTAEDQFMPKQQAGNVAHVTESVSGTGAIAISVLPGDNLSWDGQDDIECTMFGDLPVDKGGSNWPYIQPEFAYTKVALKVPNNCKPILDVKGNTIAMSCDVAPYCSARSSPPDFKPTNIVDHYATDATKVPPFWMSMSEGVGVITGSGPMEVAVWYFPFAELEGVLVNMGMSPPWELGIMSPAWESDGSSQDCTNFVKGIQPFYLPRW